MADFFDSSDAQASDGANSFEGFEAIGGGEGAEGEGFGGFDSFPTGAEVAEGGDDGFFDAPAAEGEAGAPATDAGIGWDEPTAPDGAPAADMGWGEQPIDAAPPADFEPPTEVPSFLDGTEQPDQAPVESAALMDTAAGGVEDVAAQPASDFRIKFEQEHAKLLSEKAEDENVRYQKMLEKAKLDLEEFYAERQKRTEAARKENREASQGVMDNAPSDDKEAWENVRKMIDTQSTKKDGKETTRMKEILVAMCHS